MEHKQSAASSTVAGFIIIILGALAFFDIAKYYATAVLFCLPILIGCGVSVDKSRNRARWARVAFIMIGIIGLALTAFELVLRPRVPDHIDVLNIRIEILPSLVESVLDMTRGTIIGLFLALILSGELCGKPLVREQSTIMPDNGKGAAPASDDMPDR